MTMRKQQNHRSARSNPHQNELYLLARSAQPLQAFCAHFVTSVWTGRYATQPPNDTFPPTWWDGWEAENLQCSTWFESWVVLPIHSKGLRKGSPVGQDPSLGRWIWDLIADFIGEGRKSSYLIQLTFLISPIGVSGERLFWSCFWSCFSRLGANHDHKILTSNILKCEVTLRLVKVCTHTSLLLDHSLRSESLVKSCIFLNGILVTNLLELKSWKGTSFFEVTGKSMVTLKKLVLVIMYLCKIYIHLSWHIIWAYIWYMNMIQVLCCGLTSHLPCWRSQWVFGFSKWRRV